MEQMLHVRFEGKSFDISLAELDIGSGSSDRQVKTVLAAYLE
ncbi:MAG: hypothetical protein P8X90_24320 [Desulfobacterales bacterium]